MIRINGQVNKLQLPEKSIRSLERCQRHGTEKATYASHLHCVKRGKPNDQKSVGKGGFKKRKLLCRKATGIHNRIDRDSKFVLLETALT